VEDTTAGRVTIPTLPDGPFAALYPVRRPWWKPIAARLCVENIQASLAALYAQTDDTIETYPLKAFDRLKTHHEEHEDGRLPLKDAVSLGARLRTGVKKGVPYRSQSETRLGKVRLEVERVTATTTPEPDAPPPAPPDFAEQLETLVIKEKKWGRRMWKALCLKIEDPRTSWETVAKAAGVPKAEMLDRRKILKAWRHAYLTAWRREQQRE
jgi:hypothetical protein